MTGLVFALLSVSKSGLMAALFVWVISAIGLGLIFSVLIRQGWAKRLQRPDAETFPAPTRTRLWVRSSDRFLQLAMVFGGIGSAGWLSGLVFGSDNPTSAITGLVFSTWLFGTAAAERRRRTRQATVR